MAQICTDISLERLKKKTEKLIRGGNLRLKIIPRTLSVKARMVMVSTLARLKSLTEICNIMIHYIVFTCDVSCSI
jgi:hypothetical protein